MDKIEKFLGDQQRDLNRKKRIIKTFPLNVPVCISVSGIISINIDKRLTMNITKEQTKKGKDTDIDYSTYLGKPYKVILFNDNHYDMDEVTFQIMRATNCSIKRAIEIMMEAHIKGQAIVYTGNKERCELVQNILQQIDLLTDIIPA